MLDRIVSKVSQLVDTLAKKIDGLLNTTETKEGACLKERFKAEDVDSRPIETIIQERIDNSPFNGYLEVKAIEYSWRKGVPYVELDYLKGCLAISNRIKNYPNAYNDITDLIHRSRSEFYYDV